MDQWPEFLVLEAFENYNVSPKYPPPPTRFIFPPEKMLKYKIEVI